MSDMIERVARAMQAVSRPDVDPDQLTPGPRGMEAIGPFKVWMLYEPMARAAIEAMREPTQAMLEAARPYPEDLVELRNDPEFEEQMNYASLADQQAVRADWQDMIEAALVPRNSKGHALGTGLVHDRHQLERRIVDGLKAFCDCESDFDMSPRMRARAAEFILGQPFDTLPPLCQSSDQFAENAKNLKPLEFRPRDNGKFDEIVARFQDGMVHVETLNAKACYVGFYWDDGRYCQWWINGKSPLKYHHDDGQNDPPRFTSWGVDRKPNPQQTIALGHRDSDRNPKGGDACGSVHESAGRTASPEDQPIATALKGERA